VSEKINLQTVITLITYINEYTIYKSIVKGTETFLFLLQKRDFFGASKIMKLDIK